jgi:hypothetical protein
LLSSTFSYYRVTRFLSFSSSTYCFLEEDEALPRFTGGAVSVAIFCGADILGFTIAYSISMAESPLTDFFLPFFSA